MPSLNESEQLIAERNKAIQHYLQIQFHGVLVKLSQEMELFDSRQKIPLKRLKEQLDTVYNHYNQSDSLPMEERNKQFRNLCIQTINAYKCSKEVNEFLLKNENAQIAIENLFERFFCQFDSAVHYAQKCMAFELYPNEPHLVHHYKVSKLITAIRDKSIFAKKPATPKAESPHPGNKEEDYEFT